MPIAEQRFPAGFAWGAATSAFQVEGATSADGRGESIWDRFCRTPGAVHDGATGEVACGSYHGFRGDVQLMSHLGLTAYRFSISWPRIQPQGHGRVEPRGLDHYDRLVDELLEAGIEPFPTLYHWDLPQALEERGGWTNRTTAEEFARYAELVVSRLGDRVQRWTTHNEPRIAAWLGYGWGEHAPGRCNADDAIAAAHHLLLSHGWAARRIRSVRQDAEVGIALSLTAIEPQSNLPEDAEAAGRRDATVNRWCLDPLFRGRYPDQCLGDLGGRPPPVRDGDLTAIAARLDFIGVNYYTREVVRCGSGGRPITVRDPASPRTEMGWEIYPRGLTEMLLRLHEEYRPRAIYVTENGAAFPDSREGDGSVQDSARCSYLGDHLDALAQAVSAGVPVRGYFAWSLLDNFEWAHGYSKRFGLVYVDYKTLAKTPKASFHWYRNLIATERARPYAT